MSESPHQNTSSPSKPENYYFLILITKLISRLPLKLKSSDFSFSILKADHCYDTTKTYHLQFGSSNQYPLQHCKVNCAAVNHSLNMALVYQLQVFVNSQEAGYCEINANPYLQRFRQTQNGAFTLRVNLNPQWAADLELYIEKSRYGVERMVRDYKNPKPRKQGEPQLTYQTVTPESRKFGDQNHQSNSVTRNSPKIDYHFGVFQDDNDEMGEEFRKHTRKLIEDQRKRADKEKMEKKEEIKLQKKEWEIAQAEKIIARTRPSSRAAKRQEEEEREQQKDDKRNKPVVNVAKEQGFIEKLPISPKYIAFIAILLLLFIGSSFLSNNQTHHTHSPPTPSAYIQAEPQQKPSKKSKKQRKPINKRH